MKMYRRRFIPNEIVDISSDEVLKREEDYIVTKWLPIKPREDIGMGVSYVFFKDGYKISQIFNPKGEFIYWYCDIIDYTYDKDLDKFIFIDLLVDVKIYPNGKMELLDFDELQQAYDEGIIDGKRLLKAINHLNKLISLIENNELKDKIENIM